MKKFTMFSLAVLCIALTVAWYSGGISIEVQDGKARFTAFGETVYYDVYYDATNDRMVVAESSTEGAVITIPDGTSRVSMPATANTVVAMGATMSGDISMDASAGSYFYGTVAGNTELTVTNWVDSGEKQAVEVELVNPGSAELTVAATWAFGTDTNWTASGTDIIRLWTRDGGLHVRGEVASRDNK